MLPIVVLITLAIALRLVGLGHLPGINADEAFYAVQIRSWMAHPSHWELLLTPTGRFISPFLLAVLTPFLFAEPSGWILRLPGALAGIATILLALWLLPKILPRPQALAATLLIACFPGYIAISRGGWELSQAGIVALFTVYFAWRGRWIGTLVSLVCAILMHKVQIFLAPAVLTPLLYDFWKNREISDRRKIALLSAGAIACAGAGLAIARSIPPEYKNFWSEMALRWISPMEFAFFLKHLGRLFSGIAFFQDVAGPVPRHFLTPIDVVTLVLFATILYTGVRVLSREKQGRSLAWIFGLIVSYLGLYTVGGGQSIEGGHASYALALWVPTAIVVTLLVRNRRFAELLSVLYLAGMGVFYFYPLLSGSPLTHSTYQTGVVDPKAAAAHWIQNDIRQRGIHFPVPIVAEDWWSYWPLKYFLIGTPAVYFHHSVDIPTGLSRDNFVSRGDVAELLHRAGYVVAFTGEGLERLLPNNAVLERHPVIGYGNRVILSVYRLK